MVAVVAPSTSLICHCHFLSGHFESKDNPWIHLLSSYQQRLDQPSKTNSGVGSPFVSGMLQPSRLVENWIRRHPDSIKTSLYRVAVPRNSLIVPTQGNDLSLPDWQKNSLEVLVVGDIDRESIKETKSVEWQNLV